MPGAERHRWLFSHSHLKSSSGGPTAASSQSAAQRDGTVVGDNHVGWANRPKHHALVRYRCASPADQLHYSTPRAGYQQPMTPRLVLASRAGIGTQPHPLAAGR